QGRLVFLLQRAVLDDARRDVLTPLLLGGGGLARLRQGNERPVALLGHRLETRLQRGQPSLELGDRDVFVLHGQQRRNVGMHETSSSQGRGEPKLFQRGRPRPWISAASR